MSNSHVRRSNKRYAQIKVLQHAECLAGLTPLGDRHRT